MRYQKRSIVLAAASATNIAAAQTPGAAGNLTLTAGAIAGTVPEVARRVLITTVANESGKTLIITGTDRNGSVISESMVGPNATTGQTAQDFRTVTQIAVSAAFTNNVSAGTSGVASTAWVMLDAMVAPMDVGLAALLRGVTANVTVEGTLDDPNTKALLDRPVPMGQPVTPTPIPVVFSGATVTSPTMAAISADTVGKLLLPMVAVRMTVNSGAATSIDFVVQQTGLTDG